MLEHGTAAPGAETTLRAVRGGERRDFVDHLHKGVAHVESKHLVVGR